METGAVGNPAGKSKRRVQVEETFNEALIIQGGPGEAAKLLWEAARSKEPWAIQELCRRCAPQTQSLHLVHEVNNDAFDYSKLTDEQLQQLDAILEQADAQRFHLQKEKARRELHEFVVQAWHVLEPSTPFVDGLHVRAICDHLQAVTEGRIRHLIINVPPGHAKSLLAAVFWPAWVK